MAARQVDRYLSSSERHCLSPWERCHARAGEDLVRLRLTLVLRRSRGDREAAQGVRARGRLAAVLPAARDAARGNAAAGVHPRTPSGSESALEAPPRTR